MNTDEKPPKRLPKSATYLLALITKTAKSNPIYPSSAASPTTFVTSRQTSILTVVQQRPFQSKLSLHSNFGQQLFLRHRSQLPSHHQLMTPSNVSLGPPHSSLDSKFCHSLSFSSTALDQIILHPNHTRSTLKSLHPSRVRRNVVLFCCRRNFSILRQCLSFFAQALLRIRELRTVIVL